MGVFWRKHAKDSSKNGCNLHLPSSPANFSRVTSHAIFSCQLFEGSTSPANFSGVTSPANFSCQLFQGYLTIQKKASVSFSPFRVLTILLFLRRVGRTGALGVFLAALLCGDHTYRSTLTVAPHECVLILANPLQRSRCRSALAVAPRECVLSSANPRGDRAC